jgi:hypothetical protein
MDGWVDGWIDGWVDGWVGGWVEEWMDRRGTQVDAQLNGRMERDRVRVRQIYTHRGFVFLAWIVMPLTTNRLLIEVQKVRPIPPCSCQTLAWDVLEHSFHPV